MPLIKPFVAKCVRRRCGWCWLSEANIALYIYIYLLFFFGVNLWYIVFYYFSEHQVSVFIFWNSTFIGECRKGVLLGGLVWRLGSYMLLRIVQMCNKFYVYLRLYHINYCMILFFNRPNFFLPRILYDSDRPNLLSSMLWSDVKWNK